MKTFNDSIYCKVKANFVLVKSERISIGKDKIEAQEDKYIQTDITYSINSSTSNSPNRSYGNTSFI